MCDVSSMTNLSQLKPQVRIAKTELPHRCLLLHKHRGLLFDCASESCCFLLAFSVKS